MRQLIRGSLAIAAVLTVGQCRAEYVVTYDLREEPGNQGSTAAASVAENVIGKDLARGPGINASAANNSISSSGWNSFDPAEDYFSFGFTVDPGYFANLQELRIVTRSSNTGPGELGLFYSGDDFTTNLHGFSQSGSSNLDSVVDLSALANLMGEVEFRIVAVEDVRANGDPNIAAGGTFRIANPAGGPMGITGTVTAVPEPSSLALLGLVAVAGGVMLRRRRQRSASGVRLAS